MVNMSCIISLVNPIVNDDMNVDLLKHVSDNDISDALLQIRRLKPQDPNEFPVSFSNGTDVCSQRTLQSFPIALYN